MYYEKERPIYLQLMEHIKREIAFGKWEADEKLPSTRDMAKLTQVNPNTIARVYMLLEQEGFLLTKRGLGTFVADGINQDSIKKELAWKSIREFLEEIMEFGYEEEELFHMIQEEKRRMEHAHQHP